jgi:hypothetical protein
LEEAKMIPKKHGRVSIKAVDGKEHSGYYHVENVWVTVNAQDRSRKSLLNSPDSDPEPLAEALLREIINDALIK